MNKEISVLFSGGPDSTLAALKALDRADKVHLITYHHKLMSHDKLSLGQPKNRLVIDELRHKYGSRRIIVHTKNIDKSFKRIFIYDLTRFAIKYHSYCIPWICGTCKLTMHAETIKYNQLHGISITYDGANQESSLVFPAQHPSYIHIIKTWYNSYKMTYETPVFHSVNTDMETEAYGLKSCKNTKKEHVFFSTQHSCISGLILHCHSRFYYRIFYGRNILKEITPRVLRERIPIAENIIFNK